MEPNWHQGFYSYYQPEQTRSTDRTADPPPDIDVPHPQPQRSNTGGSLLPPPPPHTATTVQQSSNLNLPPFASTFYNSSSYGQAPNSGPPSMSYGHGYLTTSQPDYNYPSASPSSMAPPLSAPQRPNPPHSWEQSPRGLSGPYSTSPAARHLSPVSPTTHLFPPMITASSGSGGSSSSYPSASRPNANLPPSKRRSTSESHSVESWEEGDYGLLDGEGRDGQERQPWGMPQDDYRALNPRDKKQVRNRIGARRFRAKRKNYVSNMEGALQQRENECNALRAQIEAQRIEINELRSRLGMSTLPLPPLADSSKLGLLVNHPGEEWEDRKEG